MERTCAVRLRVDGGTPKGDGTMEPTTTETAGPQMNGGAKALRSVSSPRITPELLERLARRVTVGGDREMMDVGIPFTGEVLGELPLCNAEDVRAAVRRARVAQSEWAEKAFSERAKVIMRYHDYVLDHQDEVLDLIQLECGKARRDAFEEVADSAVCSRYYALHGEEHVGPERRRGALPGLTTTMEYHHPRGVVGFISPWNYPLTLTAIDPIPALLPGNAGVLKPDRETPYTALWVAEAFSACGLPDDLFQIVTGAGSTIGGPLIESADFIGFTGSTATGRHIAEQAGRALIGCSLELGGKNPMIILDDADLDRAVEGAVRGCFSNTGQLCISIERLYVQSGIYERFLDRFVEATRRIKLGGSLDFDVDVGSLASHQQLENIDRHVRDAVEKGATVLAGGRARPDLGPLFYEPTILTGVKHGMLPYDNETFGPVVSVYEFDSVDDALAQANSTRYGLNASVYTSDTRRGVELAQRIQTGTVNVNEAYAATWASLDAPMGGFKDSGLGRRHGREGILKYTESQNVSVQRVMAIAPPKGVSYKQFARAMTATLRVWKCVPFVR